MEERPILAVTSSANDMMFTPLHFHFLKPYFDVRVYGGLGNYNTGRSSFRTNIHAKMHILPTKDKEYPPLRKNFLALGDAWRVTPARKWYMRCDADAVVNATRVQQVMREYSTGDDEPIAIGSYASGRTFERPFLALHGNFTAYLNGGACEILNRAAVGIIAKHGLECMSHTHQTFRARKYIHSDIEISRCLRRFGTRVVYLSDMRSVKSRNSFGPFDSSVDSCSPAYLTASQWTTLHPLKQPSLQLSSYAPHLCKHSMPSTRLSRPIPTTLPLPAYVISFSSNITNRLPGDIFNPAQTVTPPLAGNTPVSEFLTPGEVSYRHGMRKLLSVALERGDTHFVSFDDDFALMKLIKSAWMHVFKDVQADVVLLGASVWSKEIWKQIDLDDTNTRRIVNGTTGVYGSFAVVWSRAAARAVISWIDETKDMYPLDHAWEFLSAMHIPWKFVHPPLVAMRPRVTSSIDSRRTEVDRFKLHKWGDKYMYDLSDGPVSASWQMGL